MAAAFAAAVPPVGTAAEGQVTGAAARLQESEVAAPGAAASQTKRVGKTRKWRWSKRAGLNEGRLPCVGSDGRRLFALLKPRVIRWSLHGLRRHGDGAGRAHPFQVVTPSLPSPRRCRRVRCAEHVVRCRYRPRDEPHGQPTGGHWPHPAREALVFGIVLSAFSVVTLACSPTAVCGDALLASSSSTPWSTTCG